MAKLSAHGAEWLRVSKAKDTPADTSTTWERVTRAYHADGVTLQKHDARFRPQSWDPPAGRFYSWGWKVRGKFRHGLPLAPADLHARYLAAGWTVEHYNPAVAPPVDTRAPRAVPVAPVAAWA